MATLRISVRATIHRLLEAFKSRLAPEREAGPIINAPGVTTMTLHTRLRSVERSAPSMANAELLAATPVPEEADEVRLSVTPFCCFNCATTCACSIGTRVRARSMSKACSCQDADGFASSSKPSYTTHCSLSFSLHSTVTLLPMMNDDYY